MFIAAQGSHTFHATLAGLAIMLAVGPLNVASAQERLGPAAAPPFESSALPTVSEQPRPQLAPPPTGAESDGSLASTRTSDTESLPLGPARDALNDQQNAAALDDTSDEQSAGSMGRTAWAMSIVLGVIVLAALGLRTIARRQGGLVSSLGAGGRAPAGLLEVLGRFPVARGQTLVLLKLDQRVLLLSQSSGGRFGAGFRTLCEITDPEEVATILVKSRDDAGESMAERFRSMLMGQTHTTARDQLSAGAFESGRSLAVSEEGDSAALWDEDQAAGTIAGHAEDWPTQHTDTSALGSLRSRLAHWRDAEATA